jgi:hypothetical protein
MIDNLDLMEPGLENLNISGNVRERPRSFFVVVFKVDDLQKFDLIFKKPYRR